MGDFWLGALVLRRSSPKSQPGGPSPKSQPGGPSPKSQPGGPSPQSQPGGPSHKSQPGGPFPKSQPLAAQHSPFQGITFQVLIPSIVQLQPFFKHNGYCLHTV